MAKMAKPDEQGYVPIKRRFFIHPFWTEKRIFSKAEAWLDLIQTSRFDDTEAHEMIGNRKISWTRGQLPASVRYLADRWKWGKHKVENFIKLLEDEKMILRHLEDGQTIITLLKYDEHNKKGEKRGQQRGHDQGQQNEPPVGIPPSPGDSAGDNEGEQAGTARGHDGDKTNNVNKGNKDNKEYTGASAPVKSPDEIKFEQFQKWILKWAPRVAKMDKPFTMSQWSTIKKDINADTLSKLLRNMNNWKPLLNKNVSAYMTALNWSTMEHNTQNQTNGHHNGSATKQAEKIERAHQQIESQRAQGQ